MEWLVVSGGCVCPSHLRPESYRKDVATSHQVSPEDRASLFKNLASAAESGWDFSTRWFSRDRTGQVGPLSSVRTSLVVPVDLNAILCQNEATLERLYTIVGERRSLDLLFCM